MKKFKSRKGIIRHLKKCNRNETIASSVQVSRIGHLKYFSLLKIELFILIFGSYFLHYLDVYLRLLSAKIKLRRYVRDRKPFMKLRTPDINSPRKARLNLKYGQETLKGYQKEIIALKQQVRRLQKQVKTYKDLVLHLEEQNQISETIADTVLVCVEEISCF